MAADGSNWYGTVPATVTLSLGVIDIPYAQKPQDTNTPRPRVAPKPRKDGKPNKIRARLHGPWQPGTHTESGEETTGDVAQWLENKYHVMEIFFEENQQKIADALGESVKDAIDNLLSGAPPQPVFPAEGIADIQVMFNTFIDTKQMDNIMPGVPTKASLVGINSRMKGRLTPGRPSFKDTGNYENSFRAWVHE